MPLLRGIFGGNEPGYQRFRLLRGADKEVCAAYMAWLRASYFDHPPHCLRPAPDAATGFEPLKLVPLDAGSIMAIHSEMGQFLSDRPNLRPVQAETSAEQREYLETARLRPPEFSASTFDPPIDIDNDGVPDRIAYWSDLHNRPCNSSQYYADGVTLFRQARHGVALDDLRRLDATRTHALFGHPFPYVLQLRDEKSGKPVSTTLETYRPLTAMITFTRHRGTFYFDGFMASFEWGDFENRRKSDLSLNDTIAVYERRNGKTIQHCEIRWAPMNQTQPRRSK